MPAAQPATGPAPETVIYLLGEALRPLPEGALWWPARETLIVSDLHLEKGSAYARRGQMLPPYDTATTLAALARLMARLRPATLLSLGDSFHDRGAELRLSEPDMTAIRALTAVTDWVWVEGNHDPDPPAHLGGRAAKSLELGPLSFRHEPSGAVGEIAGHLHPAAKIRRRGRTVRRRCFVTDGERLVMPAMGAFTGGLNVRDAAFETVFPGDKMAFALGQGRVFALGGRSLILDGPRGGPWRL